MAAGKGGGGELAKLRAICMAIPGAMEKLSHGEPTWFTGPKGKVFAMFDNHHHGGEHISVYVATLPEERDMLVAREPERYWVPPYVGVKGWVGIILDTGPDWDAVAHLVGESFAMITAPRPHRR